MAEGGRLGLTAVLSCLLWSRAMGFTSLSSPKSSSQLSICSSGHNAGTIRFASSSATDESAVDVRSAPCTITPPIYLAELNRTVSFPKFSEIMQLSAGEFVLSDTFTLSTEDQSAAYDFCLKLYPRGGGHPAKHSLLEPKNQNSGFGMSYRILPMFGGSKNERVGVYLQFLPSPDQEPVDVSFSLRLKGQQRTGPKFDVEWRAGMRFVSLSNSKLAEGMANDFGAHLMQTPLLNLFLGCESESLPSEQSIQIEAQVWIHAPPQPQTASLSVTTSLAQENKSLLARAADKLAIQDIRTGKTTSPYKHNTEEVRVGRIVVPVLQRLSQRPRMFQQGAYPGVEFRILRIIDPATNKDLFYSQPGADYELKPIYPLVAQLERQWPVRVNERDIPTLYTPYMYNAISALGSVFTAVTGLLTAFLVSQMVSLFYIPSRSMEPTLMVGDVLLVDKLTPRLPMIGKRHTGDVILFQPPEKLREIVARSGGRLSERDLFVKRVAGEEGDVLSVKKSGAVRINDATPNGRRDLCGAEPLRLIEQYIEPNDDIRVGPGQVAVLGDCSSVSIDSRVWGPLSEANVVGRPIVRLWPPSRFGAIPELPTIDSDWR